MKVETMKPNKIFFIDFMSKTNEARWNHINT